MGLNDGRYYVHLVDAFSSRNIQSSAQCPDQIYVATLLSENIVRLIDQLIEKFNNAGDCKYCGKSALS